MNKTHEKQENKSKEKPKNFEGIEGQRNFIILQAISLSFDVAE